MDAFGRDIYESADGRSLGARSGRSTPGSSDWADATATGRSASALRGNTRSPDRDLAFWGPPSSGSSRSLTSSETTRPSYLSLAKCSRCPNAVLDPAQSLCEVRRTPPSATRAGARRATRAGARTTPLNSRSL